MRGFDFRNDLIKTAYSVEAAAVFGGPNWLELDRFDLAAKPPAQTPPATIKLMLQSLLADRFKLVARQDVMPMPAWVLSKEKDSPKLKPADPSGESACHNVDNNERLSCRNMTMDAFVVRLRAGQLTTTPVMNTTGIEGAWDFDINYTYNGMFGITENNPLLDAIDKQIGLKLELKNIPQPVLVVDSVNRTLTPSSPDVLKRPPPAPIEFEVARQWISQAREDRANAPKAQRLRSMPEASK